jgi:signal transduction histidine kinase
MLSNDGKTSQQIREPASPLKEFIVTGHISPPVLIMSGILLLAASPGAWFLRELAKEDSDLSSLASRMILTQDDEVAL